MLAAVEMAKDLPKQIVTHWLCSLRQIAVALDKPPELIQARWTAVRHPVARLHHALLGITQKTLANHKSNARAALVWFAGEHNVPARGAKFTAGWAALRDRLSDRHQRSVLSSLMRYCSAKELGPASVDEAALDAYMVYRAETSALATDAAARRSIARSWNACIGSVEGWPERRLIEPPIKAAEGPSWESFSEVLRNDIDAYLLGLTKPRKGHTGKRRAPCKPATIRVRRAMLVAAAKMAVRAGVPIEKLTSLGAMLHPDVSEPILEAYWEKDGERPNVFTIDLGVLFLSIARQIDCLDEAALVRLDDIRAELEQHRQGGLTDKNLAVVRQVLTDGIWTGVVNLPEAMMAQARSLHYHAPVKAAVVAQVAVAIAILTVNPVRLGNLGRIRLDENLIKPGGPHSQYWLVFPDYDVKNRVKLESQFNQRLSELLDEYIHDFRPSLVRGGNEPWLFPGETGGCKGPTVLSDQITKRILKATGLRITAHQFRHAAGAIILKNRPGEHELVRRVLGHRNIQTTMSFYTGLETTQAGRVFGDMVREMIFTAEDDPTPTTRSGRRRPDRKAA
ncbi:site-specific integrase [Bradyrhizobium sp. Ash2021]|uniref:site-specific integrase n=1 Tax=Bradyrhizobium sp. Ash2021 TaxID=2954771 RepID=UPI002814EDF0|nr:site-specific integrase [Bradyrhizobium sp. Ash2021]WMT78743.1 site-specific integrase [Bradyrhizobium sp. Ash2021]